MQELDWLQPGKALMGYLYLAAAHPGKVDVLLEKRISAIAYEQIQLADGSLPVLKPLSQIGGRMAAQVAAHLLQNDAGGHGKLLGGVPGVPPAEVVVIGAGVAGEAAARAFLGMGAHVTVLDRDLARLQTLDEVLSGKLVTVVAHPFHVARAAEYADVLVGAVMVPGERSPLVLTRAMLRKMKPGALFIDLSIDQGGLRRDVPPDDARGADLRRGRRRPLLHPEPRRRRRADVDARLPQRGRARGSSGSSSRAWRRPPRRTRPSPTASSPTRASSGTSGGSPTPGPSTETGSERTTMSWLHNYHNRIVSAEEAVQSVKSGRPRLPDGELLRPAGPHEGPHRAGPVADGRRDLSTS